MDTLTPQQTADLIGLSKCTVLRMVRRGQLLPCVRQGNRIRFQLSDINAWKEGNAMASISSVNGNRIIQFVGADRKRRSIRLGKTSLKDAQAVKWRVEAMVSAQRLAQSFDADLSSWLLRVGDDLHGKLVAVGLVQPRQVVVPTTLGDFLDSYIAGRTDIAIRTTWNLTIIAKRMKDHFGVDRLLSSITPADADAFVIWMRGRYAEATTSRAIKRAKQFMRSAIRARLIATDPFEGIKPGSMKNTSRMVFVSRADIAKVIDACPDDEWRLIVALARYGGLRCPSEIHALTWPDIAADRFTVNSPKTGTRIVPIYPELVPYFAACLAVAEPDAVHVIARHRGNNLRTALDRIVVNAGLVPWEKTFQNLRSTRQTELEDSHPSHVVCAWMGNSETVARDHYLQVREEHFAAATSAVQNAVQSVAINESRWTADANERAPEHTQNPRLSPTLQGDGAQLGGNGSEKGYPRRDSKSPAILLKPIEFCQDALQNAVHIQNLSYFSDFDLAAFAASRLAALIPDAETRAVMSMLIGRDDLE